MSGVLSFFTRKPKVNAPKEVDTSIYSQSKYPPVILNQESPIIPDVFPLDKKSIGEEKLDPGTFISPKGE